MTDGSSSLPTPAGQLPGRPWASGALRPCTSDADVSQWKRPHSAVIARSDETVAITMVVLFLLPRLVLRGVHGDDFLPGHSDLVEAILVTAATFVPVLVIGAIWLALGKRSAGWITIDPIRRRVEWRRMKDRAGAPTAQWSFDEVRDVQGVGSGLSFSDLMTIELPDRAFHVRVPRGFAAPLAESLGQAARGNDEPVAALDPAA